MSKQKIQIPILITIIMIGVSLAPLYFSIDTPKKTASLNQLSDEHNTKGLYENDSGATYSR